MGHEHGPNILSAPTVACAQTARGRLSLYAQWKAQTVPVAGASTEKPPALADAILKTAAQGPAPREVAQPAEGTGCAFWHARPHTARFAFDD